MINTIKLVYRKFLKAYNFAPPDATVYPNKVVHILMIVQQLQIASLFVCSINRLSQVDSSILYPLAYAETPFSQKDSSLQKLTLTLLLIFYISSTLLEVIYITRWGEFLFKRTRLLKIIRSHALLVQKYLLFIPSLVLSIHCINEQSGYSYSFIVSILTVTISIAYNICHIHIRISLPFSRAHLLQLRPFYEVVDTSYIIFASYLNIQYKVKFLKGEHTPQNLFISMLVVNLTRIAGALLYPAFTTPPTQKIDMISRIIPLYAQLTLVFSSKPVTSSIPLIFIPLILTKLLINCYNFITKAYLDIFKHNTNEKKASVVDFALKRLLLSSSSFYSSDFNIADTLGILKMSEEEIIVENSNDMFVPALEEAVSIALVKFVDKEYSKLIGRKHNGWKFELIDTYLSYIQFLLYFKNNNIKAYFTYQEAVRVCKDKLSIKKGIILELIANKLRQSINWFSLQAFGFRFEEILNHLDYYEEIKSKAIQLDIVRMKILCKALEPIINLNSIEKFSVRFLSESKALKTSLQNHINQTKTYHYKTALLLDYIRIQISEENNADFLSGYTKYKVHAHQNMIEHSLDKDCVQSLNQFVNIDKNSQLVFLSFKLTQNSLEHITYYSPNLPDFLGYDKCSFIEIKAKNLYPGKAAGVYSELVSRATIGETNQIDKWKTQYCYRADKILMEINYVSNIEVLKDELMIVQYIERANNSDKIIFVSEDLEFLGVSTTLFNTLTEYEDPETIKKDLIARISSSRIEEFIPELENIDWTQYMSESKQREIRTCSFILRLGHHSNRKMTRNSRYESAAILQSFHVFEIQYNILTNSYSKSSVIDYYMIKIHSIESSKEKMETRLTHSKDIVKGNYLFEEDQIRSLYFCSQKSEDLPISSKNANEELVYSLADSLHFSKALSSTIRNDLNLGLEFTDKIHTFKEKISHDTQLQPIGDAQSTLLEKKEESVNFTVLDELAVKSVKKASLSLPTLSSRVTSNNRRLKNINQSLSHTAKRAKQLIQSHRLPYYFFVSDSIVKVMLLFFICSLIGFSWPLRDSYSKLLGIAQHATASSNIALASGFFYVRAEGVLNINNGFYPPTFRATRLIFFVLRFPSRINLFMENYKKLAVDYNLEALIDDFDYNKFTILMSGREFFGDPVPMTLQEASHFVLGFGFELNKTSPAHIVEGWSGLEWERIYIRQFMLYTNNITQILFVEFEERFSQASQILGLIQISIFLMSFLGSVIATVVMIVVEKKRNHIIQQICTIPVQKTYELLSKIQKEHRKHFDIKISDPEILAQVQGHQAPKGKSKGTSKKQNKSSSTNRRAFKQTNTGLIVMLSPIILCFTLVLISTTVIFVCLKQKLDYLPPLMDNIKLMSDVIHPIFFSQGLLSEFLNYAHDPAILNQAFLNNSKILEASRSSSAKIIDMSLTINSTLFKNPLISETFKQRYQNITDARICQDIINTTAYKDCLTVYNGAANGGFASAYSAFFDFALTSLDNLASMPNVNTIYNITNDIRFVDSNNMAVLLVNAVQYNIQYGIENVDLILKYYQQQTNILLVYGIVMMILAYSAGWKSLYINLARKSLNSRQIYLCFPAELILNNNYIKNALRTTEEKAYV